jgi:hypothetical protein
MGLLDFGLTHVKLSRLAIMISKQLGTNP